ncbi:hypothetical protein QZH41_002442 [Actinostola sp. cb2023]|nr:hypothetical protein QZH41_002442 [Actinostola sp. cb2023]
MVQRCLPYLTLPSTRNHMKPTSPNCKNDSNCASNKYCHKRFKKCLDILAIPTLSSTKSTAVACKNDSYCTNQQYCHDFFKICLVKPTMVFNTTTSQTQFACSTNADCQAGHYCHNMTQICLQMRNVTQSTSAASRTKQHFCRTDSDCRITEFCYRIFGTFTNSKPVGARHRRKCSGVVHFRAIIGDPRTVHKQSVGTARMKDSVSIFRRGPPFTVGDEREANGLAAAGEHLSYYGVVKVYSCIDIVTNGQINAVALMNAVK